mmetsp:Transcript_470/g.1440  ORF Transcript_470/g.1440 Transcript_470/m.1440 type:complete len:117 (-) Transcript_470:230-580(-)
MCPVHRLNSEPARPWLPLWCDTGRENGRLSLCPHTMAAGLPLHFLWTSAGETSFPPRVPEGRRIGVGGEGDDDPAAAFAALAERKAPAAIIQASGRRECYVPPTLQQFLQDPSNLA